MRKDMVELKPAEVVELMKAQSVLIRSLTSDNKEKDHHIEAREAEIAALKAKHEDECEKLEGLIEASELLRGTAEARVAELEAAMSQAHCLMNHDNNCAAFYSPPKACDCSVEDLVVCLEKGKKK